MVSAVYLFSAYSLRKVSRIRNLFSFGGQLSLEYDTTESRVAWTIFDPSYCHVQNVEITSISFSTFEQ